MRPCHKSPPSRILDLARITSLLLALSFSAAADVQIARDWKPGTIDETQIKRSITEAGFKK
jgi:hypothetical protein